MHECCVFVCWLCGRVTAEEAQAAYDEAPLSYVKSTNEDYTGVQKWFEVRHCRPMKAKEQRSSFWPTAVHRR